MITFSYKNIDQLRGIPLSEIQPFSRRALVWLARSSEEWDFGGLPEAKIAAAVFNLSGLDYHYDHYITALTTLTPYYKRHNKSLIHLRTLGAGSVQIPDEFWPTEQEQAAQQSLHHEAIAYLNRVGQFLVFAKSLDMHHLCGRCQKLLVFRNKHTAHRSIDDPRGETVHTQELQAMTFHFHELTDGKRPIFQITNDHETVMFEMEDDHKKVMGEAMMVLLELHNIT